MIGEALIEFGVANAIIANRVDQEDANDDNGVANAVKDQEEEKDVKYVSKLDRNKISDLDNGSQKEWLRLRGWKVQQKQQKAVAVDALRRAVILLPPRRRAAALIPLGALSLDLEHWGEAEAAFGDAVVLCSLLHSENVAGSRSEVLADHNYNDRGNDMSAKVSFDFARNDIGSTASAATLALAAEISAAHDRTTCVLRPRGCSLLKDCRLLLLPA